jgi:hypothetical protein
MRLISNFAIASLVLTLLPSSVYAADPYANAVYQASNQVYLPSEAIGASDQVYAQMLSKDANLTLDMGEGEEGTDDLTLYFVILNFGAAYRVEFKDENFSTLQTSSATFQLYTSETAIDYSGLSAYRYVTITSIEDETWKLDAIEAAAYQTPTEPAEEEPVDEEEPPAEEPAEEEEEAAPRGLLVKLTDDGDPSTTVDAAVYVIGEDGTRHAFPTESVYNAWWENFDDVAFIDSANLATYPLEDNVTVRPGTFLVKIQSDPKVYAVEPGGVLRWITSEAIAKDLYGTEWASRVIDVPDAFFSNYTSGSNIEAAVFPDGTIGYLPSGQIVYFSNGTYYTMGGSVFEYMRFQSEFLVSVSEEELALYVDGGELGEIPDIAYPY